MNRNTGAIGPDVSTPLIMAKGNYKSIEQFTAMNATSPAIGLNVGKPSKGKNSWKVIRGDIWVSNVMPVIGPNVNIGPSISRTLRNI